MKLYKCTVCKKKKQLNEFYLRSDGKVGEYKCKACIQAKRKEYTKTNYEGVRESNRKAVSKHQKKYPERNNAKWAKYQANKKQAVPKWVDTAELSKIRSLYKTARKMTKLTGVRHEVDHVIPLRGKEVSGLHTLNNLQVIPNQDNLRKGNLLLDDIVCS